MISLVRKSAVNGLSGLFFAVTLLIADEPQREQGRQAPDQSRRSSIKQSDERDHHQDLVKIKARLQALFQKSCPQATVRYAQDNPDELVAEFQTRNFQVYARSKSGKIADEPHNERGPDYRGFLMRVTAQLQSAKYVGAADIPQDLREPYWTTFINAVDLSGEEGYLWLQLSYGSRTDKKLLATIKEAVGMVRASED
jgi:hypothetical protein